MKKLLMSIFLGLSISSIAQNKQILYGFDQIPQTLMLNPGTITNYKYHVGMPLLSGVSANFGISGITVADVFRDDTTVGIFSGNNFNTKLANAINNLGDRDYAHINAQVEVLNAGYRLDAKNYLSFGYYTEADVFLRFPKDLMVLAREGNGPYLNRTFLLSQIDTKAEVLGAFHIGLTRSISNKLVIGGRLKMYSGSVNVLSTKNKGAFTTTLGDDSIYVNDLNNIELEAYSSGILNEDNESIITVSDAIGNTFFSSNFGLGLDLGFTYKFDDQTEVSASLLDIGYISYSNNVRNGSLEGSYKFSGLSFEYDPLNPQNYWQNLKDRVSDSFNRKEDSESYSVMRPIKFYSSFKYKWGKSRNESTCHDISFNNYYDNAAGAQLYSVYTPIGLRFALTGFLEHRIFDEVNTKVTYTIDDFSSSNFGLGVSTKFWKVNVYGMVDNVFNLFDIADAHSAAFQIGINYIVR